MVKYCLQGLDVSALVFMLVFSEEFLQMLPGALFVSACSEQVVKIKCVFK